jgi:hypothetical protein
LLPYPNTIFLMIASLSMPYHSAWRTWTLASHGAFAALAFHPM